MSIILHSISDLERISDHAMDVEMITIYDNDYSTHEYFKNFSSEERASFDKEYEELLKRYPIGKQDAKMLV